MEAAQNNYQNYHAMVTDISEGMQRIGEVCDKLNMQETRAALIRSREKMNNHKFAIGILGEFKRGKSTVINALLGREIIPSDILPTSATMNRVTYGLEPRAQILLRSGESETIGVDELVNYVTKLDEEKAAQAELVEEAIVFYPCEFCQNGVDIVDTPGLNDEGRMDRIVEEVIPKLDAVIMVITPDSPFSMSESEFVRTKLMTSDIGRLIFLVNKFDIVRKRDQERVLREIRSRIEKGVLDKMRDIHGEDSDVYRDVRSKLANIRIFPVSARDALDGRLDHDEELVESSGMPDFEKALGKMLTEERGALELGIPISQVFRSCDQALEMIGTCRAALDCNEEQFREAQRRVLEESKALKESQLQKSRELNEKAKAVKRDLRTKAAACYDAIEEKAGQIIGEVSLDNPRKALTAEEKQGIIERTSRKISEMTNHEMSVFSERIINELNGILGKESLQVAELVSSRELKITNAAQIRGGDMATTAAAIALDTVAAAFTAELYPGIGGMITGYRSAGVKGALVGGGTAFASSCALVLLLAPMGIVGLPLWAIACSCGTLAGKTVCDTVFAKSRNQKMLDELKASMRAGFDASCSQMRKDREIEKWIDETVEGQFNVLISGMDGECRRIVNQANETIQNIKLELTRSAAEKKSRMEEYERMQATVEGIREKLTPLRAKLAACIAD